MKALIIAAVLLLATPALAYSHDRRLVEEESMCAHIAQITDYLARFGKSPHFQIVSDLNEDIRRVVYVNPLSMGWTLVAYSVANLRGCTLRSGDNFRNDNAIWRDND